VSKGNDLFDCFLLIQALEEAVTIDAISKLYGNNGQIKNKNLESATAVESSKKYELFSQEQMNIIVEIVNKDEQLKALGVETQMTMDLAVQLNETGKTYSFSFENGRIAKVGNDSDAEFLISAPENIWRAVFNREIDPFVATTQKKMNLRGDFAKISKWYAPCSRIFELWASVPVQ
jgi:putative sterol carrier protein